MLRIFKSLLGFFASLRLTVVLMALSMLLVFTGTLAQASAGVWQTVDNFFRSPVAWVALQDFFPIDIWMTDWQLPIPGGLTIGVLLMLNLVAAHVVRFRVTRKRIGLLLLHAGLIVLLLGEFGAALYSEEGLMSIPEGGTSNYVEDIRTCELVVIDSTAPGKETVVTVPETMLISALEHGDPITHPKLPFALQIEDWHTNSRLFKVHSETRATQGIGLDAYSESQPTVRGVDGAAVNTPSAYVSVLGVGRPLGVWLVSAHLTDRQTVEHNNKTYEIALRFKRRYKSYSIKLLDFKHERHVGTNMPASFSSDIRLIDPANNTDRAVTISMNNPLRYAGETFYQASFLEGDTGTVLQVVRNPSWLLPYVACVMVTIGLLIHLLMKLSVFMRRNGPKVVVAANNEPAMRRHHWIWNIAIACIGIAIATHGLAKRPATSPVNVDAFGRLPVMSSGRIKPLDTVARNTLMIVSGRQTVKTDDGRIGPTQFLLMAMGAPESIRDLPLVRVDHPDVLTLLNLSPQDHGRLPLSSIEPFWMQIRTQAMQADEIEPKRRDSFQRAILQLHNRVDRLLQLMQMQEPLVIPPTAMNDNWRSFREAVVESVPPHVDQQVDRKAPVDPAVDHYVRMMTAFHQGQFEQFNDVVGVYLKDVGNNHPDAAFRSQVEVLFNRANLFYGTTIVDVIAFLLACFAILARTKQKDAAGNSRAWTFLRGGCVSLLVAALVIHTIAILLRIYLQGRPPVTNLYSSAVFVGWAAVLLGIICERFFPICISGMGAAAVGFCTLIVAHNLGNDGDTMHVMQAVLDSNFWLSTHVITITLGYAGTFFAGALAIVYVVLGMFTKLLTPQREQTLGRMVYGIVCFSLLLSFVGTVLGGIWADQSWGRFWGWDPKENGAVLVVLINAIILHARWCGVIRTRGMMNLAIAGNIVTAWSWFGTNMLGVGLHSYGFVDSAVFTLMLFVVSQLLLIAFGLLPFELWRSFRLSEKRSHSN